MPIERWKANLLIALSRSVLTAFYIVLNQTPSPIFEEKWMDDERYDYARRVQRVRGRGHCLYSREFVAHGAMADSELCSHSLRSGFRIAEVHVDERRGADKPGFPPDNGQDGDILLLRLHGVHD